MEVRRSGLWAPDIADSIRVALGIGNWELGFLVLWSLKQIIVLFCMRERPMTNCQSNLH